jgi:hypothetical protein
LTLLGAAKVSDEGLLDALDLRSCRKPLHEDCITSAFDARRDAIAAAIRERGLDAWLVVLSRGGAAYDGSIWTLTTDGGGGVAKLSYRAPYDRFDPAMWLDLASRAGLCAEEQPCAAR